MIATITIFLIKILLLLICRPQLGLIRIIIIFYWSIEYRVIIFEKMEIVVGVSGCFWGGVDRDGECTDGESGPGG